MLERTYIYAGLWSLLYPLFKLPVRNPRAKAQGLCLSSIAILHIWKDVQLWLQRSTHQGTLTRYPSLSRFSQTFINLSRRESTDEGYSTLSTQKRKATTQ